MGTIHLVVVVRQITTVVVTVERRVEGLLGLDAVAVVVAVMIG